MPGYITVILALLPIWCSVAAAEQKCLSDLLVILDNSGSVEHDFSPEKDIAAKLVDDLNVTPPDTRVGLVEFNQAATSDFSFNKFNEKEGVVWAIRNLTQVGGSTNTADALKLALEEFQNYGRRDVNKILLLITDGNSQNTLELLRERTNELSRAGVVIFTATTSESPGLLEFQIYSQNQPDRVFLKSNLTSLLTKISKTIHEGTCIKPLEVSTTGYGPPPTEPQTVPPPINCKQFQADIVFLVDGSSSIGLKIFQDEALRFIKDFVSELDIGPDKTHVAFVQYSHYIRHEFDLKDFSTKEDTIKAISGVQYIEGRTLTGGAIKDTVENAFSKANGAREKAAKVILVITDGRAQDDVEQPAKAARNAGIRMIAVGVTDHILESELKEIAGDESRVKIAINYTALNDGNLRRLLEAITCNPDVCPENNDCGAHSDCKPLDNGRSYTCLCLPEFDDKSPDSSKPGRVCEPKNIDRCADKSKNQCSPFASCENIKDGYQCRCLPGYVDTTTDNGLLGRNCAPSSTPTTTPAPTTPGDPCRSGSADCSKFATCTAIPPAGFSCKCNDGYVDESEDPIHKPGRICLPSKGFCDDPTKNTCHKLANCREEANGFSCKCKIGTTDVSPDPINKPGQVCKGASLCDDKSTNDCVSPAVCDDSSGSVVCNCPAGYTSDPSRPAKGCIPVVVLTTEQSTATSTTQSTASPTTVTTTLPATVATTPSTTVATTPSTLQTAATLPPTTTTSSSTTLITQTSTTPSTTVATTTTQSTTPPTTTTQPPTQPTTSPTTPPTTTQPPTQPTTLPTTTQSTTIPTTTATTTLPPTLPPTTTIRKCFDCSQFADCIDSGNSYTCKCRPEYEDYSPANPGRFCRQIVTTSTTPTTTPTTTTPIPTPKKCLDCDINADCIDLSNSYTCRCRGGYEDLNSANAGRSCRLITTTSPTTPTTTPSTTTPTTTQPTTTPTTTAPNKCLNPQLNTCSKDAKCTDLGNGAYSCKCSSGYIDTSPNTPGQNCVLDKCSAPNLNDCDRNAECQSTPTGSYTCRCKPDFTDFTPNNPGRNCQIPQTTTLPPPPKDKCAQQSLNDCSPFAMCKSLGNGEFTCACKPGFNDANSANPGRICNPSRCSNGGLNDCDKNAKCTETLDSFTCSCVAPYNDVSPSGAPGRKCELATTAVPSTTTTAPTTTTTKDFSIACGAKRCNTTLNEACVKGQCVCQDGQARNSVKDVCEDAEGHVMLLLVKRKNNDVFKFVPLYANEANPNTKFLWNTFVNGIEQAYITTPIRPGYISSTVNGVLNPKTFNSGLNTGLVFNFTVWTKPGTVSTLDKLRSELINSIILTDYSIGGTDLFIDELQLMCGNELYCEQSKHEVCDTVAKQCVCEDGYERDFKQDCKESGVKVNFPLRVIRKGNTILSFNKTYSDPKSAIYINITELFIDGIRKAFETTSLGDAYTKTKVEKISDPKTILSETKFPGANGTGGLYFNFTVYLKNDAEKPDKIYEKLLESIRKTNYSIGGTDLYVSSEQVDKGLPNPEPLKCKCKTELGEVCINGACVCPSGLFRRNEIYKCTEYDFVIIPVHIISENEKPLNWQFNYNNSADTERYRLMKLLHGGLDNVYNISTLSPIYAGNSVIDIIPPQSVNTSWTNGVVFNYSAFFEKGKLTEKDLAWTQFVNVINRTNYLISDTGLRVDREQQGPNCTLQGIGCSWDLCIGVQESFCGPNATCYTENGVRKCRCKPGFNDISASAKKVGNHQCLADKDMDFCDYLSDCHPLANCTNLPKGFKCECDIAKGYRDADPTNPGHLCTAKYTKSCPQCNSHGECIVDPKDKDKLTCKCKSGYFGDQCEVDIAMIVGIILAIIFLLTCLCCCLYFCLRCNCIPGAAYAPMAQVYPWTTLSSSEQYSGLGSTSLADKADHYGALNTKIPRPRVTPPGTTREEVAVSSRNLNDYLDAENERKLAAQRLADEAALAARQANSVEQMAGRSEILSDVHHALPAGTTVKTRSRWTGSGSEYDSASNSGSEASWVEHTERRVITDVTRSETTRVGGSAAASAIMDSSATAEFRIYPPALASTSANQTRDSRSVASSRLTQTQASAASDAGSDASSEVHQTDTFDRKVLVERSSKPVHSGRRN